MFVLALFRTGIRHFPKTGLTNFLCAMLAHTHTADTFVLSPFSLFPSLVCARTFFLPFDVCHTHSKNVYFLHIFGYNPFICNIQTICRHLMHVSYYYIYLWNLYVHSVGNQPVNKLVHLCGLKRPVRLYNIYLFAYILTFLNNMLLYVCTSMRYFVGLPMDKNSALSACATLDWVAFLVYATLDLASTKCVA